MESRVAFVGVLVLLVSQFGCTSGKPPVTTSIAGLTVKAPPGFQVDGFRPASRFLLSDANGEIVLKDYEFRCEHAPVDDDKSTDCTDIPVVIVWDAGTQSCHTVVPYNKLVIHTKGKQKTKIVWTIAGPKNAKFDSVGIELNAKDETSTTPAGDVYEDAGMVGGDGKRYTLSVKANQSEKSFGFKANVSIGANSCASVDPLIVNAEN